MKRSMTLEALEAFKPCDMPARRALFGKRKSLTAAQALKSGASVSDILWIAGRLGLATECALFAQGCADAAAEIERQKTNIIAIFGDVS